MTLDSKPVLGRARYLGSDFVEVQIGTVISVGPQQIHMGDQTADQLRDAADQLHDALNDIADDVEPKSDSNETITSARQAAEKFADEHPNIVGHKTSSQGPNMYFFHYNLAGSPGHSNIGSGRTDAETALEQRGYEIDLQMAECTSSGFDYDMLLRALIVPTE